MADKSAPEFAHHPAGTQFKIIHCGRPRYVKDGALLEKMDGTTPRFHVREGYTEDGLTLYGTRGLRFGPMTTIKPVTINGEQAVKYPTGSRFYGIDSGAYREIVGKEVEKCSDGKFKVVGRTRTYRFGDLTILQVIHGIHDDSTPDDKPAKAKKPKPKPINKNDFTAVIKDAFTDRIRESGDFTEAVYHALCVEWKVNNGERTVFTSKDNAAKLVAEIRGGGERADDWLRDHHNGTVDRYVEDTLEKYGWKPATEGSGNG